MLHGITIHLIATTTGSFEKNPFRNRQERYVKNISVYFNLHEVLYDNLKK